MSKKIILNDAQNIYMLNNKEQTLEFSTEENHIQLSLNHIQNLQIASAMSGNEISFNSGVNGFLPVEVIIMPSSNEIGIKYLEDDYSPEKLDLKDYTYILSMLLLS
jgi:hypothetical protein